MLVIPAIDLKDGQAVRLFKGDYSQKQFIVIIQKNLLKLLKKQELHIYMLWI